MKAFLLSLLAAVVVVGGVAFYLHRKIAPLLADPSLRLDLAIYTVPTLENSQTHVVDLGYCSFALPNDIIGTPTIYGDSLFVQIESGQQPHLLVNPPNADENYSLNDLSKTDAQLGGIPAKSLFEFEKRALMTKPFSPWAPLFDRQRAIRESVLLLTKSGLAANASYAGFYEHANIEALILDRPDFVMVIVHDRGKRVAQGFMLHSESARRAETVHAILRSYRFLSNQRTSDAWRAEAISKGVPVHLTDQAADRGREKVDLEKIVSEVQARRARRATEDRDDAKP